MTNATESEALRAALDRLGIAVPPADMPFLLRAYQRQRQLVDSLSKFVPPQTEPAHVFAPSRSRAFS